MKRINILILLLLLCSSLILPSCDQLRGQPPVINSFDAEPTSISAGDRAMLSWEVSGASRVSIEPDIGDVALSGKREVMPAATTVYTLVATSATGATAKATVQVMVEGAPVGGVSPVPGAPKIVEFWAKPSNISSGEQSNLIWNVQNATSVTIEPGIGAVNASGTRLVSPASTTTYTLTATNAAGSTTATAQVVVSGGASSVAVRAVVNSFNARPKCISKGCPTTLSWSVSNATSVSIDQGIGPVPPSGTRSVSPTASTTYTLTATNDAGSTTAKVQVAVKEGGMGECGARAAMSIAPSTISAGGSATLRWEILNATSWSMTPDIGAVDCIGSKVVSPTTTTTYVARATGTDGSPAVASVTVTVTGGGAPANKPDLIITGVELVDLPGGGTTLKYTIKNRGSAPAGASSTELCFLQSGQVRNCQTFDQVPPLAAGASISRQPFTPEDSPGGLSIGGPIEFSLEFRLRADAMNAVNESDENNNEFHFMERVKTAWKLKVEDMNWQTGPPAANISPGGNCGTVATGCATRYTNLKMENDATVPEVLETHPKWVTNGWVQGYSKQSLQIKPHSFINGTVGLIKGAEKGNVTFEVLIRPEGGTEAVLASVTDTYDGKLKNINAIVPASYVGKKCYIGVRVRANNTNAEQAWAGWLYLAITEWSILLP